MEIVIKNKYRITTIIGNGTFGTVYRGSMLHNSNKPVIIKIETQPQLSLLRHETTILRYLGTKRVEFIPIVYWYGIFDTKPTLVMSDCGEYTLDTFIKMVLSMSNGDTIDSMAKVLFNRAIYILKKIHSNGVVHRDIKPQNIMVTVSPDIDELSLSIIDFGMASFWIDVTNTTDMKHIGFDKTNPLTEFTGNMQYASPFIHVGYPSVRRDDYISLLYSFLDAFCTLFIPISLPSSTDNNNNIYVLSHPIHKEWIQYKMPEQIQKRYTTTTIATYFITLVEQCYSLSFEEIPTIM